MDVANETVVDSRMVDNLTDWQRAALAGLDIRGHNCLIQVWLNSSYKADDVYCKAVYDGFHCWPDTSPNTTISLPCPWTYPANLTGAVGYRTCTTSGEWLSGIKTDYSHCIVLPSQFNHTDLAVSNHTDERSSIHTQQPLLNLGTLAQEIEGAMILRDIYFGGSIVSLVLLVLALFIFAYFTSLQCSRVTIHRNLITSFILRSAVITVMFEPSVTGRQHSYRNVDWMCKTLTAVVYYSMIANTAWMFVEALFLHAHLTVSVFQKSDPLGVYYFIGWGLAIPIVISWATCMHFYNPNNCWIKAFEFQHSWIIMAPILAFLTINALFLVNIVRIIVTKLHADNSAYADKKIRTAARATLVLFPLFGLTGILFCIEPKTSAATDLAYRVVNAILQSSQGIFVSFIYCFFNKEVQTALSRKWRQCKQRRAVGQQIQHSHIASYVDLPNNVVSRWRHVASSRH